MIHTWIKPKSIVVSVEKLSWTANGLTSDLVFLTDSVDKAKKYVSDDICSNGTVYRVKVGELDSMGSNNVIHLDENGDVLAEMPKNPFHVLWDSHTANCARCREKLAVIAARKFHINEWPSNMKTVRNIAHSFIPTGRKFENGYEVFVNLKSSLYVNSDKTGFVSGLQLPNPDEHIEMGA